MSILSVTWNPCPVLCYLTDRMDDISNFMFLLAKTIKNSYLFSALSATWERRFPLADFSINDQMEF